MIPIDFYIGKLFFERKNAKDTREENREEKREREIEKWKYFSNHVCIKLIRETFNNNKKTVWNRCNRDYKLPPVVGLF